MVPLKPRDVRNYVLTQNLSFGLIAKICILRILEEIHAVPQTILLDIIENLKTTESTKIYTELIDQIDSFLINFCKLPTYIVKEIHLSDEDFEFSDIYPQLELLIPKIHTADCTQYFKSLEDDFLGKLIEYTIEKKKGVVYTPKRIIRHINEQLLQYIFESPMQKSMYAKKIMQGDLNALPILDPACGTSPFLINLFEKLSEILSSDPNINRKDIPKAILRNLYGVDIDKHAIYFSRINLWLSSIIFYRNMHVEFSFSQINAEIFPILEENLVIGDSLLYIDVDTSLWDSEMDLDSKIQKIIRSKKKSQLLKDFLQRNFPGLLTNSFQGFRVIIGNPPYVSSKDLPLEYKELLRVLYTTAVHQFDIYSIFIELSISILSEEGYFGFIIPESYLGRSSFTENRRLLLRSTQILRIENIHDAFPKKSVSNIILYFQNRKPIDNSFSFIRYQSKKDFIDRTEPSILVPQNYCYQLENSKILCHSKEIREIIQKLHRNSISMSSMIKIHRGEEIGKKSNLIIDKPESKSRKIIFGENIKRFYIEGKNCFIRLGEISKDTSFYFQPKIVVRQLGNHLQAAYDKNGEFVTLQTVYNIISTHPSISHQYLVGILNSDLIQFYYHIIFKEKQIFPRILLENILQLPIIIPSKEINYQFEDLVNKIILLKQSDESTEEYLLRLNEMVYSLFKINEKEKKTIRSVLNA